MKHLIDWIRSLDRYTKRLILVCMDFFSIAVAFAVMHEISGFHWQFDVASQFFVFFALNALITLIGLAILGVYKISIRFLSNRVWSIVAISTTISSCSIISTSHFLEFQYTLLTIGIHWIALFTTLIFSRLLASGILNYGKHINASGDRCAIYGAGDLGVQLSEILQRGREYSPIVFIDDNSNMHGMYVRGLPVMSFTDFERNCSASDIKTVFMATPNASQHQIQAIFKRLENSPVKVFKAGDLSKFTGKNFQQPQFRRLEIEDLLGRSDIAPVPELMAANIRGKEVLITGAGGSIGSELCRQVLSQNPIKIILLESSEFALYKINQELADLKNDKHQNVDIVPVMGSVQDPELIDGVLEIFDVSSIFHAAAYKHVPIVEMNIIEAVKNNVFGTLTLANAANKFNVPHFTLISTDKAVRPTNFMGATKRTAEMICQALDQVSLNTQFSIVRFGNVFGSSGSVVPAFHRQILAGSPITLTHPNIVRFFMSISEAAQLVIQSSALAKGGEIFTLNMGEPVKILDVAKLMARLYGLTPVTSADPITNKKTSDDEIEIRIIGLRPGEKLYEELSINGEFEKTIHPKINATLESFLPFSELEEHLNQLQAAISARDLKKIKKTLNEAPICFAHNGNVVDIFSKKNNT